MPCCPEPGARRRWGAALLPGPFEVVESEHSEIKFAAGLSLRTVIETWPVAPGRPPMATVEAGVVGYYSREVSRAEAQLGSTHEITFGTLVIASSGFEAGGHRSAETKPGSTDELIGRC